MAGKIGTKTSPKALTRRLGKGCLAAAAALQVEPKCCYVLEDSHNGIRAAYRAGMHPVMVPDMQQPTEEIRGIAEAVVENLLAALEYLQAKM